MVAHTPEPTFDMTKLKTSMLTAENWLALKQDWIDFMNAKLNTKHSQFQMAMEEHNKEVNPSGVPFKGRKRTRGFGARSESKRQHQAAHPARAAEQERQAAGSLLRRWGAQ